MRCVPERVRGGRGRDGAALQARIPHAVHPAVAGPAHDVSSLQAVGARRFATPGHGPGSARATLLRSVGRVLPGAGR